LQAGHFGERREGFFGCVHGCVSVGMGASTSPPCACTNSSTTETGT
jgi:hypothetical protein